MDGKGQCTVCADAILTMLDCCCCMAVAGGTQTGWPDRADWVEWGPEHWGTGDCRTAWWWLTGWEGFRARSRGNLKKHLGLCSDSLLLLRPPHLRLYRVSHPPFFAAILFLPTPVALFSALPCLALPCAATLLIPKSQTHAPIPNLISLLSRLLPKIHKVPGPAPVPVPSPTLAAASNRIHRLDDIAAISVLATQEVPCTPPTTPDSSTSRPNLSIEPRNLSTTLDPSLFLHSFDAFCSTRGNYDIAGR